MKDYYEILGIPFTATEHEIRSAYREKMKLYHPDNVGEGARDRLFEVKEAHEILSDRFRRLDYDYEYQRERMRNPQAESVRAAADAEPPERHGDSGKSGSAASEDTDGRAEDGSREERKHEIPEWYPGATGRAFREIENAYREGLGMEDGELRKNYFLSEPGCRRTGLGLALEERKKPGSSRKGGNR